MRWVAIVERCSGAAMEYSYLGSLRLDLTGTSEGTVNLTHVVDLWELLDDLKGDVGCLWVANRGQSLSLVQSWLKIDGEKDGDSFGRGADELGWKMGVLTLAQVVVGRPSRRMHAKMSESVFCAPEGSLNARIIWPSARLASISLGTCVHLSRFTERPPLLLLPLSDCSGFAKMRVNNTVLVSLALVNSSVASLLPGSQYIFSNPSATSGFRIPTVHESAVQARRILHLENIGTLSTVFPSENAIQPLEQRPSGLGGVPIGLMDYYADCEPDSGNPTILALDIATSFKNVAAGSNITLSLRWHPQDGKWHSAASLPRFSLVGHLEDIDDDASKVGLATCFVKNHPDAAYWLPGNRIHTSRWVRLVVEDIYWIGGFGDRAYIGWIPVEAYQNVTQQDIDDCKLPGEKSTSWGWSEWL